MDFRLNSFIGNSGKFTEQGQVLLNVCRLADNGSQWLSFKVKDTGIGITTENQKKLFQAFTERLRKSIERIRN
jgi:signal transduction histidine kinase